MSILRATVPDDVPADVASQRFADAQGWDDAIRGLLLSPQQERIVQLILQGKRDKEIAADLGLSKHTVRTYLDRIFLRLGVTDRVGVVLRVAASHRDGMSN